MTGLVAIGECMVEIPPAGDGLHRLGSAGDAFNGAFLVARLRGALVPRDVVTRLQELGGSRPWVQTSSSSSAKSGAERLVAQLQAGAWPTGTIQPAGARCGDPGVAHVAAAEGDVGDERIGQ